ncbi:hypothetical protein OC834_007783, partial [Tilletia horrida]
LGQYSPSTPSTAEEQALVAARWDLLSRERLLREAAEEKLELADKAIGTIIVERDEALAEVESVEMKISTRWPPSSQDEAERNNGAEAQAKSGPSPVAPAPHNGHAGDDDRDSR